MWGGVSTQKPLFIDSTFSKCTCALTFKSNAQTGCSAQRHFAYKLVINKNFEVDPYLQHNGQGDR